MNKKKREVVGVWCVVGIGCLLVLRGVEILMSFFFV
jgi:hypothetical protein